MDYKELRLRDPGTAPSPEILKEVLDKIYPVYCAFIDGLEKLEIQNEWQYYPCVGGKAWMARGEYKWTTPRGANKTKNIYWMSAWDKYFVIAVWFKEDNRGEVLKANVSEETKQLIRGGKMFGPKMRTFPVEFHVTDAGQLDDIYTIIKWKQRLEAN